MDKKNRQYEISITIKNECTALQQLSESTHFSNHHLKQMMQKGALWRTRGKQTVRIRRAKKIVAPGDQLHLYYDQDVFEEEPTPAVLIYDAMGYSVWYKPYGMYSQGTKWGDHCTVYRWAEAHLKPQRPAFIVHRLDRAATGLILIAHKKRIASAFTKIFQARQIRKKYQVIVQGEFPEQQKRITIDREIDGKKAVSHVRRLSYHPEKNRSLLDIRIETGRKHQIRIHLSQEGFPVVGDRLYGSGVKDQKNLQLCAVFLSFLCPVEQIQKEFAIPEKYMLNV